MVQKYEIRHKKKRLESKLSMVPVNERLVPHFFWLINECVSEREGDSLNNGNGCSQRRFLCQFFTCILN